MILCVTLNPALDHTLLARGYTNGGVFRAQESSMAAGGKGLNVARAAEILGEKAICAGFLGGFSGQSLAKKVEETGMQSQWTWLKNRETRSCVILVDPEKQITSVINEQGPQLGAEDWQSIRADLFHVADKVSLVTFAGSLPPGLPLDGFGRLCSELIEAGKQVWVDSSGAPLEAVWQIKGLALKINEDEASALLNCPIKDVSDAVDAAKQIFAKTSESVVITLGKQGAVLVNSEGIWQAIPPEIEAKSAVGSGDSFLAGLLVAFSRGAAYSDSLAQASAAGTANALSLGGGSFSREDFVEILKQVQVIKR